MINAPPPGYFTLRPLRGVEDLAPMLAVADAARSLDSISSGTTLADMKKQYVKSSGFDPERDVVIAESDGQIVGYARGWWLQEVGGAYLYRQLGFVVPAWRRNGIGRALLEWLERRQSAVAAQHNSSAQKLFNLYVTQPEIGRAAMLEKAGYTPARYFFSMLRSDLEKIRSFPLPAGIKMRPVVPEHYRAIWEIDEEVFASHWGGCAGTQNLSLCGNNGASAVSQKPWSHPVCKLKKLQACVSLLWRSIATTLRALPIYMRYAASLSRSATSCIGSLYPLLRQAKPRVSEVARPGVWSAVRPAWAGEPQSLRIRIHSEAANRIC